MPPTEITEKHNKRIDALIKSGNAAIILTIVGIFIPIITVLGPLIGFGYAFEANGLLKRYPHLDEPRAGQLRSAKTKCLVMGGVLGAWLLIGIGLVALAVLLG